MPGTPVTDAADDRPGVPHPPSRRRGLSGDEPHHGLLHVVPNELRGSLFGRSANFANHDDRIGFGIVVEGFHDIDVLESVDGVAPNADRRGLAEANFSDADCRGINFFEATLTAVSLAGADCTPMPIHVGGKGTAWPANFVGADLSRGKLANGKFHRADFSGAILIGADLRHADLTDAKFADVDLTGANLEGAVMTGADFTGAVGLSNSRQPQRG